MIRYIIITGNPVEGFTFYGSFDTIAQASAAGDHWDLTQEWWVARLWADPGEEGPDEWGEEEGPDT